MMLNPYFFREHPNFLSEPVIDAASRYCDHLIGSTDHVWTTNFEWQNAQGTDLMHPKAERYENLVLVHKIYNSNRALYDNILKDIQKVYPTWSPETVESMQFFVWTGGSRIEWHKDFKRDDPTSTRIGAITIYMNRNWEIEWGGDFLYKDKESKVNRITPAYNKAVALTDVEHRSTTIQERRFRKCIQIFLKEDAPTLDNDTNFC